MSEDNGDTGPLGEPSEPARGRRRPRRGSTRRAATGAPRRRRLSPGALVILGLLALLVLATVGAHVWTDKLWFDSVRFGGVFSTQWGTRVLLGVLGFLLGAVPVGLSMWLAYRHRPLIVPVGEEQGIDYYRRAIEPVRRVAAVATAGLIGLFVGMGMSTLWEDFLLWRNRTPFGIRDPYFNRDVGFFVFELPWWRDLLSTIAVSLIAALAVTIFTHYLYGGIARPGQGRASTRFARAHACVLAALILAARAVDYWFEQFSLTTARSPRMTGIRYVADHASVPALNILAIASAIAALIFVAAGWMRSWRVPVAALVALLLCSVGVGSVFPAAMQALHVGPSENQLEQNYLETHIKATRAAYGINDITYIDETVATKPEPAQLRAEAATLPGIRIMDPNVLSPTFKQGEGDKVYYEFPDTLDVDRYTVGGKEQDVVVAARELDVSQLPAGQQNWLNRHTTYTHGYGLVVAKGNTSTGEGKPSYLQSGFTNSGELGTFEPRIYFGERSPAYSIVGGNSGQPREFDYPGGKNVTYAGSAGVSLSGINRLAYAVKYRESNFLLSDAVTPESKILENRSPRERVAKAAPWLMIDGNVYPAIVDGRIVWIVDGYTTSANYPNSQLQSLSTATRDAITSTRSSHRSADGGEVNYIRNSVKATVDAYSGEVSLYQWDTEDPLLKTWMKVYPGSVKPRSAISGSLMAHLRYPEDLFKVQRELLTRYHVDSGAEFYSGGDFWRVPIDPSQGERATAPDQPPYYLSVAMHGEEKPSFSLTTAFAPQSGQSVEEKQKAPLTAYMSVNGDAGSVAGQPSPDYGKIRLQRIGQQTPLPGPSQVFNDMRNYSGSSADKQLAGTGLGSWITNNNLGGSSIVYGNLLTLPFGGGYLYVQPIYTQAKTSNAYPVLKVVVASFGNSTAWASTPNGALNELFGTSGTPTTPTSPTTPSTPTTPTTPGSTTGTRAQQMKAAVDEGRKAYTAGEEALKKGDFAEYGRQQAKVKQSLDTLEKLAQGS